MFQPQFQIDPEILEALRAAFQRYLLSQPVSATFVDHHAESSRVIASGPCQAHAFSVDPGNPEANQDSLIVGTCEGCTENTFGLGPIQFGGENTTGDGRIFIFLCGPGRSVASGDIFLHYDRTIARSRSH
jgi:hypothetical protein